MTLFILTSIGIAAAGLATAHAVSPRMRLRRMVMAAWRPFMSLARRADKVRDRTDRRITQVARGYEKSFADTVREKTPVEVLKDYGASRIRWSALEEAGIRNVKDLAECSQQRLERISGIGETSVESLTEAGTGFDEDLASRPVAHPESNLSTAAEQTLVAAAKSKIDARDTFSDVAAQVQELRRENEEPLKDLRRHTGFLHWLLRLKEPEGADLAGMADDLTQRAGESLDGAFMQQLGATVRSMEEAGGARFSLEDLEQDYRQRRADYAAVIEQALRDGAKAAGVEPGELLARLDRGRLPDDVLERIEGYGLNLDGLALTLRGYQHFGARFILAQNRTILGDEMGLGKTIQALAAMVHLRNTREGERFLVVAPASVAENWAREVSSRTPFEAHMLRGSDREEATRKWLQDGGVAITSYSTLRGGDILGDLKASGQLIDLLVVDEAHYAKNPEAGRSKAVRSSASVSPRICLMTGTPVENRLSDFRNIALLLGDDVATGLPDESDTPLNLQRREFMEVVAPVYLRRNQVDVLHELPEKIEVEEWVELGAPDSEAYREAVISRNFMAMRRTASIGDGQAESAKMDRLGQLLEAHAEEGKKVLLFSFFLDVLACVAERFPETKIISGSVPLEERQRIIDEFQAVDGPAVIAAQIVAGGVGLNLQAASVVILVEPQWKPSTENQAIARAHRMGQTERVIVHRLLAKDCVDERMFETVRQKQEIFDTYVRDSSLKNASEQATESRLAEDIIASELRRLGAAA